MNKTFLMAAVAALLVAPLALASSTTFPKNYCESNTEWAHHFYVTSSGLFLLAFDGNLSGDCNGDTVPGDYDNHLEGGIGGVILTVNDGDPACAAEPFGHHTSSIHVQDDLFGFGVGFSVGADYDCDNVSTIGISCVGWCIPPFPPGRDGAYHVYVDAGTKGHITTA